MTSNNNKKAPNAANSSQKSDKKRWMDKLFKYQEWRTKEYKKQQKEHIKLVTQRGKQTKQEKQIYADLKAIAEEDFLNDNKEQKFRIWHLDKALEKNNIDPGHYKFFYGKKNIGKTWELARRLRRLHAENPEAQFVFIRNKRQDKQGVEECFKDDIWPIEICNNKLYWKQEGKRPKRSNRKQAGIFVWSTAGGFQGIQGSSYKNVELIIWDECNDIEGGYLTHDTLSKFCVFTSSIVRDKGQYGTKPIEVIMTGNLLSKGDRSMNLFLSSLKVDPDVTLKIIDIHKEGDTKNEVMSRLIYVNTHDFYKGIEEQVGLATQFLSDEELSSLLTNTQLRGMTKSIYSEYEFYKTCPQLSIVFTLKEEGLLVPYILYIGQVKNSLVYVAWIDKFKPAKIKLGWSPITHDLLISCNYVAPQYIKEVPFCSILKFIAKLLLVGQLFYGYNDSMILFTKFWEQYEPLYIKGKNKAVNI